MHLEHLHSVNHVTGNSIQLRSAEMRNKQFLLVPSQKKKKKVEVFVANSLEKQYLRNETFTWQGLLEIGFLPMHAHFATHLHFWN